MKPVPVPAARKRSHKPGNFIVGFITFTVLLVVISLCIYCGVTESERPPVPAGMVRKPCDPADHPGGYIDVEVDKPAAKPAPQRSLGEQQVRALEDIARELKRANDLQDKKNTP